MQFAETKRLKYRRFYKNEMLFTILYTLRFSVILRFVQNKELAKHLFRKGQNKVQCNTLDLRSFLENKKSNFSTVSEDIWSKDVQELNIYYNFET